MELGQSLLFHRQVRFDVLMGRHGAFVAQPQCDDTDIDARLQQVHGCCVPLMPFPALAAYLRRCPAESIALKERLHGRSVAANAHLFRLVAHLRNAQAVRSRCF